ncbi:MAG: glutathione S-transferase [Proteobacteria bacterium]|nr:glutathione S-transferase [Pseudomonadota bacterium]
MNLPVPLKFKGAPGSPYTRKMLALLRYRRIPYELLIGDQAGESSLPNPKVNLLPTFYLPNDTGEIEAVVDSTPLIRRFEAAFDGRSTIPPDPSMAFINYLLEDYGDEWLTKAMFHYRWYYKADIEMAGKILPRWRNLNASDESLMQMSQFVCDRQISRLHVVGSNEITAPVIEDSYRRFLKIMNAVIEKQTFLMGSRPGSADFAVYAQLTQLVKFDPTPTAICMKEAPRVYAWTDVVDDLSGLDVEDNGFLAGEAARSVLGELLAEIGRVYVPALLANARAIMSGKDKMETVIDGRAWVQPTFPYQGKCLQWIRDEYQTLSNEDRARVDTILEGTGCEPLFEN